MAHLEVHVVTADGVVWNGNASSITVTASDGEIGILPGHAPLLAVLVQGSIRIHSVQGEDWSAILAGGFFSVDGDKVAVVADGILDETSGELVDGTLR